MSTTRTIRGPYQQNTPQSNPDTYNKPSQTASPTPSTLAHSVPLITNVLQLREPGIIGHNSMGYILTTSKESYDTLSPTLLALYQVQEYVEDLDDKRFWKKTRALVTGGVIAAAFSSDNSILKVAACTLGFYYGVKWTYAWNRAAAALHYPQKRLDNIANNLMNQVIADPDTRIVRRNDKNQIEYSIKDMYKNNLHLQNTLVQQIANGQRVK